MPKKQSTAAQRAREAARQGGKYTRVLRSIAGDHDSADATAGTTEPGSQAPRCAVQPCHPKLPLDALVCPGDGRDPLPACELHAAWLLAALPGANVKASPDARFTPGGHSGLDLDLVRSMARSLTEEHEQTHDGTWACLLCDPERLPS
ncbi:hypothetical protein ACFV8E_32590 [Streptomyces sp. NPDC059849]|uniref:hypothetical protein n=1 Tax=Streptomyces sp. NPDC059849 TaxID=3346969 RepID=UPI00365BED4F